jgi:hypothetical protein
MKAITYIRKGWTQRIFAVNSNGVEVSPHYENAVAWCARGAVEAAYLDWKEYREAMSKLRHALGGRKNIFEWNDAPERTKKQVLAAFKKAGI